MTVNVRFIGSFRSISGKAKIVFRLKGSAKLEEVVRRLCEETPKLAQILMDPGRGVPRTNMLVLVNGREISVLNGFGTLIEDGDDVVFVPILHGG